MELNEIEKGDTLLIKGKNFQVVEDWDEGFDELSPEEYRWYSIFEMIEIKSKKMTATHTLIYYQDEKDIFLINKINQKKQKVKKEEIKLLS